MMSRPIQKHQLRRTKLDEELIKKAKSDAIRYLSYRERSTKEVRDKLYKKKYSQNIIEFIINYLTERDYLNDKRFTQMWLHSRINYNPRGRKLIYHELIQKGIKSQLIESQLQNLSEKTELNMGLKLAEKWLRSKNIENKETQTKLKRYLVGKGFNYYLIKKVINNILAKKSV